MFVMDKKGNRRRVDDVKDLDKLERMLSREIKVLDDNKKTLFKSINRDIFRAKIR